MLGESEADAGIEAASKGRQNGKYKKVWTTGSDAAMGKNARDRRLEPACKQHTAVDDDVAERCEYSTACKAMA